MATKSKKVLAKSSKVEKKTNAKAEAIARPSEKTAKAAKISTARAKKATAKKSAPKDRTGMRYKIVREAVQSAPNVRELAYIKHWEDGTKERAPRKCYGSLKVVTLKDGTRKVNGDTLLYKGGAVTWRVEVTAHLCQDDSGAWRVCFHTVENSLSDIVDMLHDELAEREDLSGTLEGGNIGGVFFDMVEGLAESEPLTDEQAAKVRAYFTPDWLDAKPGPYVGE